LRQFDSLSSGLPFALVMAQSAAQRADEAFARGVERQRKGDLAGARQAYEEAGRLAPRRVDGLSNLGLVLSQLGEQSRAIQCFHDALIIDPNQPIVRFNLGLAYMRAGQFEPARTELTKVVRAQPGNLTARNLLGLCLLKLGRLKEGVTELEVVRHAHAQDLDVASTLASAYIRLNQLAKPNLRPMIWRGATLRRRTSLSGRTTSPDSITAARSTNLADAGRGPEVRGWPCSARLCLFLRCPMGPVREEV
jgi:cytochrome c-type biogenesis protein CcmH/NrfG